MKHLTLLFLSFISSNTKAQIVVGLPELLTFYRGYNNQLEAASQNGVKKIKLESKDFEFVETSGKKAKTYSCIARVTTLASTGTIYMLNAKNNIPIDTFEVRITKLPTPSLYFGASEPGSDVNRNETKFFSKYLPEIPLHANFQIVSGTIKLPDNSMLYFTGNQLSDAASKTLKSLPENSTIWVEVYTIGPDGLWRIVKSTYRI